jgi:uncharacterized membrane protein
MSLYQWLLALHVTGAFFVIGGSVIAATLALFAQRRERPSEVALFLGLTRVAVVVIGIGFLLTIVLGLWLVHEAPENYSYWDAWVILSIVLWVVAAALGSRGGERDRHTRELAERLAAEGDAPSAELRARLRDPVSLTLSWGSGAAVLAILALMIWKPGS